MKLSRPVLTAVTLGALAVPAAAPAAPGDLDPSFGSGGITPRLTGTTSENAHAVAVDPQGRIVVTGTAAGFAIERLTPAGKHDDSFGGSGIVFPANGNRAYGRAVEVLPDGRILAGGVQLRPGDPQDGESFLARVDAQGAPDASFGTGGVVRGGFAPQGVLALSARADGAASILSSNYDTGTVRYEARRLTAAGQPDAAFDGDGRVLPLPLGSVRRLAEAPGGRLLAAGSHGDAATVARLDAGGAPDATFGDGGIAAVPGTTYPAADMAVDGAGRILVLFSTGAEFNAQRWGVARFTVAGRLDACFGDGGLRMTGVIGFPPAALVVGPDDAPTIAGQVREGGQTSTKLVHLTVSGDVDAGFGTDGVVTRPGFEHTYGLAAAPDGDLVLPASQARSGGSGYDNVVARFQAPAVSSSSCGTPAGGGEQPAPGGSTTQESTSVPATGSVTSSSGVRRIKVSVNFLSAKLTNGKLRVLLTVPKGTKGTAKLTIRRRGGQRTLIASRTVRLTGASKVVLRLPVTKAGRKLLTGKRLVKVVAALTVTGH